MPRICAVFDTNGDAYAMNSIDAKDAIGRFPARYSFQPPAGTLRADGSPLVASTDGLRVPGPQGLMAAGDPRRVGVNLERFQGIGDRPRIPDA